MNISINYNNNNQTKTLFSEKKWKMSTTFVWGYFLFFFFKGPTVTRLGLANDLVTGPKKERGYFQKKCLDEMNSVLIVQSGWWWHDVCAGMLGEARNKNIKKKKTLTHTHTAQWQDEKKDTFSSSSFSQQETRCWILPSAQFAAMTAQLKVSVLRVSDSLARG